VRVAAGPLKLTVAAGELRAAAAVQRAEPSRPASVLSVARTEALEEEPVQTRDNTCDLRGLRVDDALGLATSFLDRAIGDDRRVVFLLHGHGSGALREALRTELGRSRYVARFRGGAADQGGEGMTIVWLA
jgi:DNA mismatch repair protein MutS2